MDMLEIVFWKGMSSLNNTGSNQFNTPTDYTWQEHTIVTIQGDDKTYPLILIIVLYYVPYRIFSTLRAFPPPHVLLSVIQLLV